MALKSVSLRPKAVVLTPMYSIFLSDRETAEIVQNSCYMSSSLSFGHRTSFGILHFLEHDKKAEHSSGQTRCYIGMHYYICGF